MDTVDAEHAEIAEARLLFDADVLAVDRDVRAASYGKVVRGYVAAYHVRAVYRQRAFREQCGMFSAVLQRNGRYFERGRVDRAVAANSEVAARLYAAVFHRECRAFGHLHRTRVKVAFDT